MKGKDLVSIRHSRIRHGLRMKNRHMILLGHGYFGTAYAVATGYRIEVGSSRGAHFDTHIETVTDKQRTFALCTGCKKHTNILYLSSDQKWFCHACMGLEYPGTRKVSVIGRTEDEKYRQVFHKFTVEKMIQSELWACVNQPLTEFYQARPYLIPPIIDRLREVNPTFYWKALTRLRRAHRTTLRTWMRNHRRVKQQSVNWLFKEIESRIVNGLPLTKENKVWLSMSPPNQKSTTLGKSDSSPRPIISSSKRTNSARVMSVPIAEVSERLPAPTVSVQDRAGLLPGLSAISAKEQE